jgi:hypothetical protein
MVGAHVSEGSFDLATAGQHVEEFVSCELDKRHTFPLGLALKPDSILFGVRDHDDVVSQLRAAESIERFSDVGRRDGLHMSAGFTAS